MMMMKKKKAAKALKKNKEQADYDDREEGGPVEPAFWEHEDHSDQLQRRNKGIGQRKVCSSKKGDPFSDKSI